MMVFYSVREATSFDAKTAFAATFLKVAALACAVITLLLAAIVLSYQGGAWILTGEWSSFSISEALALAGIEKLPESRAATDIQMIFDWGLDLPVSGFLSAIAAILMGFSVFAASVEKQFRTR